MTENITSIKYQLKRVFKKKYINMKRLDFSAQKVDFRNIKNNYPYKIMRFFAPIII